MKFAEHLSAHLTPEWRKQYIEYETLKKMLHMAQHQAPKTEVSEPAVIQRYYASLEERFFQISEKELTKINTFYAEKLAEAQRRLATLQIELEAVLDAQRGIDARSTGHWRSILLKPHRHRARHKKICDLKLAFSELYLNLVLLQNYQNLNLTGFSKILKKYDKMFNASKGASWQTAQVESSTVYTSKKIDQLISEVESAPVWTTFRVGVQCGLIMALSVLIIIKGIYVSQKASVWPLLRAYRGGFILIEFVFLLGINIYGWRKAGVNHCLIFELDPRNHVSHQELFELAGFLGVLWCLSVLACLFSAYIHTPMPISPLVLYGFMVLLLLNPTKTFYYKSRIWLLKVLGSLLCSMRVMAGSFRRDHLFMYPEQLVEGWQVMCLLLFLPGMIRHQVWRYHPLHHTHQSRVLTAPFHKVGFADFWLADQLNSMGPVFLDLWSLICFYTFDVNWENNQGLLSPPADKFISSGNSYGMTCFIQCIPPWIRFTQCLRRYRDSRDAFPHLANAGKYSTVFIMVTFAALYSTEKERSQLTIGVKIYFYLWAVTTCVSTIFTIGWDLKMDWGLLDKKTKENKFLREETVYQYKVYYYCAILQDVVLRVAWALNILFTQSKQSEVAEIISTTLAPLEVFRRFVWNFFRLENEHLNNCGHFRAVRDISIMPLTGDNQATLLLLMDQQEGVRNRGKVKCSKRKTNFSFKRSRVKSWETKIHIEETE